RVVGVQRAEYHVPRQRRLHGDLSRLQVADFAHQNLVRVLPQNAPKCVGERQLDVRVDLTLADAVDFVFDGVFGGDDLVGDFVQLVEGGIECRGFAGARRAGDEVDSVWLVNEDAERGRQFRI